MIDLLRWWRGRRGEHERDAECKERREREKVIAGASELTRVNQERIDELEARLSVVAEREGDAIRH